jgi:hypothetical protein
LNLQLFSGTFTLLLLGSVAATVLSTNKKDLERAAELAVERAAEKAAERAVEKALNSGNSSTITVTVKESYSNAKKTAEEAAAPGSESTRPYDPKVYNSQYAYEPRPPTQYKVTASGEDEEYSGDKDPEADQSVEYESSSELSSESIEQIRAPLAPTTPITEMDSDNDESEFDATSDADSFDINSDASFQGNFGLKSTKSGRTETFSRSYSSPKTDFADTKVEVDDNEDAKILKLYATQLQKDGWSSARQKGWIRHRPLWDDSKVGRIDQEFWNSFGDMSVSESAFGKDQSNEDRQRLYGTTQLSLPAATMDFSSIDHLPFYQMFHRQVEEPPRQRSQIYRSKTSGNRGPIKLFLTIPVAYPPIHKLQNDHNGKIIEHTQHLKKQVSESV